MSKPFNRREYDIKIKICGMGSVEFTPMDSKGNELTGKEFKKVFLEWAQSSGKQYKMILIEKKA